MTTAIYVFNKGSIPVAFEVILSTTIADEDGNLRLIAPMAVPGVSDLIIDRVEADSCYKPDPALIQTVNMIASQMVERHTEIMDVLATHGEPAADKEHQSEHVWH
jgi:hypothetical protein